MYSLSIFDEILLFPSNIMNSSGEIREGDYTKVIYNLIKDQQFLEAITLLEDQLELHPNVNYLLYTKLTIINNRASMC